MSYQPWVLTLVSAQPDPQLPAAGKALIEAANGKIVDHTWLAPDRACDLQFIHPSSAELESMLRRELATRSVDLHLQPVAGRRKGLLMADMESTVIHEEMLDELAAVAGCGAQVADITARAMNGDLDFRQSLEERLGLLAGLPQSVLEDCAQRITLDSGAAVLVATLQAHGVHTALVTSGFDFFAERVRSQIPFDTLRANRLLLQQRRVVGTAAEPVLDKGAKLQTLRELCAQLGLNAEDVVAVGDGANDLPMLEAAGLGVAYHGKPRVAAAARGRIEHGDLSVLLYYQGYSQEQLVEPPQDGDPTGH